MTKPYKLADRADGVQVAGAARSIFPWRQHVIRSAQCFNSSTNLVLSVSGRVSEMFGGSRDESEEFALFRILGLVSSTISTVISRSITSLQVSLIHLDVSGFFNDSLLCRI